MQADRAGPVSDGVGALSALVKQYHQGERMIINRWKLKYKITKKKGGKRTSKGYRIRKFSLSEIGYASYQEYLASEDWKKIRKEKLEKFPVCLLCDKPSCQVHHLDYDSATLLGLEDRLLAALCDSCHEGIEFNHYKNGEKRTIENTNKAFRAAAKKTERGMKFLRNLEILAEFRSKNKIRLGAGIDHAKRHRKGNHKSKKCQHCEKNFARKNWIYCGKCVKENPELKSNRG